MGAINKIDDEISRLRDVPAAKPGLLAQVAAFPSRNMENPPSLLAQLDAGRREFLKDVNNTLHQVVFGQGIGQTEMGTPLAPTPGMIDESLEGPKPDRAPQPESAPDQEKRRGLER